MHRSLAARQRAAQSLLAATLLLAPLLAARPAHGVSLADKKGLAEEALRWAIGGGFPEAAALQQDEPIVVSNYGLSRSLTLEVPGRKVVLASFAKIQAAADITGSAAYFVVGPFNDNGGRVEVGLTFATAVSSRGHGTASKVQATLTFERRSGAWHLLPDVQRP